MSDYYALAIGCGTQNREDEWLEVYFPDPVLNPDSKLISAIADEVDYDGGNLTRCLLYTSPSPRD